MAGRLFLHTRHRRLAYSLFLHAEARYERAMRQGQTVRACKAHASKQKLFVKWQRLEDASRAWSRGQLLR